MTPWRFGMVVDEKPATLDDEVRTVEVKYLSHPEEASNQKGILTTTTRRTNQLIVIVDPTETTLNDEF